VKRTSDYLNEAAQGNALFYELSEEERASLKKCLLEIYTDVARVCEKRRLCVMLGGGSALGAVRHKGFIPWDDDFDALMPREDYNRLIEIFDAELGGKYVLSVPSAKHECKTLFMLIMKKHTRLREINDPVAGAGLQGVKIDVFPIDNAPDNVIARKLKGLAAEVMRVAFVSAAFYQSRDPLFKKCFMRSLGTRAHYYIRYLVGMVLSVFKLKTLYRAFDRFVSSGGGTGKYCNIPTGRLGYAGETHPRGVFFPPSTAVFEGLEVKLPHDAGAYLRRLYGDFMTVPPPEKRERHFYTEFSLDA